MRELPTGTVTFLFTDIEGSTRLLDEHGDAYPALLDEHRRVLREAVARHGGIEVDTQGDALFVAFARASDAVAAADEAQRALRIPVRMGIHTGEPTVTAQDYVGIDVHRAARMCSAGHGGQVLLSQTTRELVEVEVRDLGEHRLKDLGQPVRLYQLGDREFPPLRTISNTNLPRPASAFVGRETEVSAVVSMVKGGAPLLTLTGPGGTGKTRLAIEAATELVPEFKAGVFWAGLAPLRDADLVLETISETLGAKNGLADHIGERELLLLLDNFEQVVEAAAQLGALLERCPNLALLVTSRELLRVGGEVEFPVLPLADREAVDLFCDRARLTADEAVAELCGRLDNLPLALELAAARTSVLSPRQMLARLSGRLDLLKGGRGTEDRQQTLRATIEWSHDLLSEDEQRLFARLGVFVGGCTVEAAETVAEADLDGLQSLVDKSLVRHTDERFWMLETIREFALERLGQAGKDAALRRDHFERVRELAEEAKPHLTEPFDESGATAEMRRAHAAWCLVLAEEAEPELSGERQTAWFAVLDLERDNVRAALSYLADVGEPELRLRLTVALTRFWYVRGYLTEGRGWLELARADAGAADPNLLRRALTAGASFALLQGDYTAATALAEESLEAARATAEPRLVANALSNLGAIVLAAGDTERAEALLEEAVALAREVGDERIAALAINNLGDLALTVGDLKRAEPLFQESLALLRARGDTANVARALFNLAAVAHGVGRLDVARMRLNESVVHGREAGDKEDLAWCLEGFAALEAAEGRGDHAAELLGAADALLTEMGAEFKPFERRLHEETSARALELCGPDRFAVAMARGAQAELDHVLEMALAAPA